MARLACVNVSALPLQWLLGCHPDWRGLPVAVVTDERAQSPILWVNRQARRQGIRSGMRHAAALCALTNPTVNSYKRINAPVTASGATWSPNTVTWSGNNRTHMVRTPDSGRFEFRLADGAANPYLLQAAYLAAGLDGIENRIDPGKHSDEDMYAEGRKVRAKRLPLYLVDAVRALDRNKVLQQALGTEFVSAYVKIKMNEWDDYSRHLTDWERTHTLDT